MIEYILEGQYVELSDETDIELTISINDIRNPLSTNNTWSKTIQIPGTSNNNVLFKYIYQNNISSGYNPNLKKNVEIRVDSIPIIIGYQQIKGVTIINDVITYEVVVYGDNTSLFEQMGDKLLTDLDLSRFDHIYDRASIEESWTNTIGYYYPAIRYNDRAWTFENFIASGDTYNYYPSMFVKTIIDQIFDEYGYTYESNFFNSDEFKSLIVPFTNSLAQLPIENIVVENAYYGRKQYPGEGENAHDVRCDTGSTDLYDLYTPTNHTCNQHDGTFCDYWCTSCRPAQEIHVDYWMGKIAVPVGGSWTITLTGETVAHTLANPTENARCDHMIIIIYTSNDYASNPNAKTEVYRQEWQNPSANKEDTFGFNFTYEIPDIYEGRHIWIKPYMYAYAAGQELFANSAGMNYTASWTLKPYSFIWNKQTVTSKIALPAGLKQKDFLNQIIKMFNLYFERDPLDNKKLTIEPFNLYYAKSDNNVDWTYKVDMSNRKYRLMSELNVSSYHFSYKSDTDYMNKLYTDNNSNKVMGELTAYNQNDFIVKQEEISLPSSPTGIEVLPDQPELIIPSMYIKETDETIISMYGVSGYTGVENTKWNWRILSKNVIGISGFWVYNGNVYSNWYTASHICNYGSGNTSKISLYFDTVNPLYTFEVNNNKTLYDEYWNDYLDLIRHQNSKMLTVDVYLTEQDISKLRFYQKIFIDEDWYYLNQLIYSPTSKRSQAELLLIPSSNYQTVYYSDFYLTNYTGLFEDDVFQCNLKVTNMSRQDQNYSGWFSMVNSGGTDVQDVIFSGIIPANTTIIVTKNMTATTLGNYLIYVNTSTYTDYISIHIDPIPYLYQNIELDPPVEVYVGDSIELRFEVFAQDPDITREISLMGILNGGEVHAYNWTSDGVDWISVGFTFVSLTYGTNTFTIWSDEGDGRGSVQVGSIQIVADAHPVLTFDTRFMVGTGSPVEINNNFSRALPAVGVYEHIIWYVDYNNTTPYDGTVQFKYQVNLPVSGAETFWSPEVTVSPSASGTTQRASGIMGDISAGPAYDSGDWLVTMYVDGREISTTTISNIHWTASAGHITTGAWAFSPANPNTSQEQGSLTVYYTINNDGYSPVTGLSIFMDMYNDYEKLYKAYATKTLTNQTVAIGGSTFSYTYTNLPDGNGSALSNPASMYLESTVVGRWYDNPGTEGYYPLYIQPCPWSVDGDIDSLTAYVSGGTTQCTVDYVIANHSCHQLDAADYLIRVTWYSDNGTTVYSYDYGTQVDVPSNGFGTFQNHIHPPNTWSTGTKKVLIELNINGEGYYTIQEGTYQYYQMPMTAANFVVTSHSITQNTYHLQVNINVRNDNQGTGTVSATHLWYNPLGTQIRGTQTSSSSILSGRTETLSNSIYMDEWVNGTYTCVSTLKYSNTGITGSPVTDTVSACFYTLGTATYSDLNFFVGEAECGGKYYEYSVHRATITLSAPNSGATANFILATHGTGCTNVYGDMGNMTVQVAHGATTGYYQYVYYDAGAGNMCSCGQKYSRVPYYFVTGDCGWTRTQTNI